MPTVSVFTVSLLAISLLSPLIAYIMSSGLFPGGFIKREHVKSIGAVEAIKMYRNSVVIKRRDGKYVGVAFIDLGDALYRDNYRTLEDLYLRARNLGRLLTSSEARVELRFHVVPLALDKIEKRLERELEALKTMINSYGPRAELVDRERRISSVLEMIKRGERASWFSTYIIVYVEGRRPEEAAERAIEEARNIANSINIIFGGRAALLSRRQIREVADSLFLGPPRARARLKTSGEQVTIPLPPVERDTLSPRGIFLGYRSGSKIPFMLDLAMVGTRHVLIIGPTGRGKTTLLATIANRASARRLAPMLIVDPKGDIDKMLTKTIRRVRISSATLLRGLEGDGRGKSLKEIEDEGRPKLLIREVGDALGDLGELLRWTEPVLLLLDNLTDEGRFLAVGSLMKEAIDWLYTLEPSSKMRKIVVIDEAWRSSEASVYYTRRLVKESRSFGVSLILSTQSAEDLPKELLSNFGTVIVFGGLDSRYAEGAAGLLNIPVDEAKEVLSLLGVGQALVKLPDTPAPVQVDIEPDVNP